MKKIIAFMLILSILICAVSCTDRVHMDDITDEYERNIYTADPSAQIGDAVMVAEGIPYSEMLDLLEQHIAVDLDFDFPCEGEFITEATFEIGEGDGYFRLKITDDSEKKAYTQAYSI